MTTLPAIIVLCSGARKYLWRAAVCFGFLLSCSSSVLSAQNNPLDSPDPPANAAIATPGGDVVKLPEFRVTTEADRGYLAGNSVSATRVDTAIKNLPFAISAFTQQFILDIGARDLWDIVQYAPGVTNSGREFNGGNARYTIRGFDQTPQHDGFSGEAYVDTVSIERVEIVKGPASVLYGQVAPGGTVNYITKRPKDKPAYTASAGVGSYAYFRATADINQPIVPKTLLFRFNGAWENGLQYYDFSKSRTSVIAPDLLWRINDRVSLNINYQYFERREDPPAQMKPNIEIVGPAPASGILAGGGILARSRPTAEFPIADGRDPGFLGYYPLPETFNYASRNDWRISKFDTLNAELTIKLGAGWTLRGNYNYSKSSNRQKLTGVGAVSVDVPDSYTSRYATYVEAATAFAADVLRDTNVALLAPHAQLSRRQRLQETFGRSNTFQVEAAGSYQFTWGKIKPLVGAYYRDGNGVNRIRQTGSAGAYELYKGVSSANTVPNPAPWDFRNPGRFPITYDTDFVPGKIPLTSYTNGDSHDKAAYAILNTSFLDDTLYAIAGLRYNKSDSQTTNYLANAATTNPVAPKFTTSKTTPQAGIGYKILPGLLAYASYSQSYVQNAGYLQIAGQPGPPAKPTTSEGYELGVKTDFLGGRISSTISIYQIDQKDRIISFNSFNPSGGVVGTQQQGTVDRSRGIEAEITWSPLDNFQVYASVAENDIRVKKVPAGYEYYLGTHPEASVKTLANIWARYTVKEGTVKGGWIGLGGNYVGKKAQRVNNPDLFFDDYVLVNAALGYDWEWRRRKFSAVLNWNNATGVEYFPANQQRGLSNRVTLTLAATF